MLKARGKACPGKSDVFKHAAAKRADACLFRELVQRLGLLGRPIVVGVAIGEHKTTDQTRVTRGEYLRDAAAAVIGNDIDLFEVQSCAELGKHRRLGVERQILVDTGSRCSVRQKVDRDAPPASGKPLDQRIPEVAIDENAMDEN